VGRLDSDGRILDNLFSGKAILMKKKLVAAMLVAAAALLATPRNAGAHDYQRNHADNPLRVLAYPIHMIGTGFDFMFTRPIHWFVSRPNNRILFGHSVGIVADVEGREEVYFDWKEYR
jgi:hypothetical protein